MKLLSRFLLSSIVFISVLLASACGEGTDPPIVIRSLAAGAGGAGGAGSQDPASGLPPAPASVRAVTLDGGITLQWASVGAITTYNVYLASEPNITLSNYASLADGQKITSTGGTSTTVTGLTNEKKYYFMVAAVNNVGEGAPSLITAGTPKVLTTAIIHTSMGDIELELYQDQAPISVSNFNDYISDLFYSGTIFHRITTLDGPDRIAVIQGGGFEPGMNVKQTTHAPIVNEANNGLKNVKYTIAMARQTDPNSATSQFFINVEDNPSLDFNAILNPGYAVFGRVTAGMDVVDAISAVETDSTVPKVDIIITGIEITSDAEDTLTEAPANVRALVGNEEITLRWDAVATATSYNIYSASEDPVASGALEYAENVSTSNSFTLTGLANDRPYFFVVTAVNNAGESDPSTQITATPKVLAKAVINTTMGSITVELYDTESPATVANFLAYINDGFYADTIIHLVTSSMPDSDISVIEGGGFTQGMVPKIPGPTPDLIHDPIVNESDNGLLNERGTIAMVFEGVDPDSATTQFLINVADNSSLDGVYAVFGKVIEGMDVVDAISQVNTVNNQNVNDGVPSPTITVGSIGTL